VQTCWIYNIACKVEGCTMRLKHLKQNTIWPLKMLCAQIHINLIHACDCLTALLPSVVKNRKCKLSHRKMSLKFSKFPLRPIHLPQDRNCKNWGWTGQAIFLYTGRSHSWCRTRWLVVTSPYPLHSSVCLLVLSYHYQKHTTVLVPLAPEFMFWIYEPCS